MGCTFPSDCPYERMKSLRRTLFDRLVLFRRPSVPMVQMACAMLGSLGMARIILRLHPDSPLYRSAGGELVELIVDDVLTPHVLASGQWQLEEVAFLSAYGQREACVLIDIGANLGLVTRQLMHQVSNISAAVCFEPHPENFRVLSRNLAHLPHCYLEQAALGTADSELTFYEDTHNVGNYSLNPSAMQGKEHRTSIVKCLKATDDNVLSPLPDALRSLPLLWKSDTQGFDEAIVTNFSDAFWARVQAGVMEIWRIERPEFDRRRLGAILQQFPMRRFGDSPERNLSVEEVLRYTAGRDGKSRDLHFARD